MTQLDFTLEAIRQMNDPCLCAACGDWFSSGQLRPVAGSVNEKIYHVENRSKEIRQTVWVCLDCLE